MWIAWPWNTGNIYDRAARVLDVSFRASNNFLNITRENFWDSAVSMETELVRLLSKGARDKMPAGKGGKTAKVATKAEKKGVLHAGSTKASGGCMHYRKETMFGLSYVCSFRSEERSGWIGHEVGHPAPKDVEYAIHFLFVLWIWV